MDAPLAVGVRSASDGLIGLACLAMFAAIAIGRRRDPDRPSSRMVGGLGLVLALCGSVQIVRAVTARPDRLAAAPVLAGATCWAAALTLRTRGDGSPVVGEPAPARSGETSSGSSPHMSRHRLKSRQHRDRTSSY